MPKFVKDKYKKQRVERNLEKNINDIILTKIPNELCKLASINQVVYNDDMSIAKIYVSHLDKKKNQKLIDLLNKKSGDIRSMLSKSMSIYKVPELIFMYDDLIEKVDMLDELFEKVHNENIPTLKDLEEKNNN